MNRFEPNPSIIERARAQICRDCDFNGEKLKLDDKTEAVCARSAEAVILFSVRSVEDAVAENDSADNEVVVGEGTPEGITAIELHEALISKLGRYSNLAFSCASARSRGVTSKVFTGNSELLDAFEPKTLHTLEELKGIE